MEVAETAALRRGWKFCLQRKLSRRLRTGTADETSAVWR